MRRVGIAELKSHLSEYLRAVRRGQTITIFDRETPVAQIVPVPPRPKLKVRMPAPDAPPFNKIPLPPPLKIDFDIVDLLLEDRQNWR
jgi:prevent-host-death family protein